MPPTSHSTARALFALSLSLAACAPPPGEAPTSAATALVGKSKAALLACAGTPAAAYDAAGVEYLSYRTRHTVGVGYLQSVPRIPVIGSLSMGGKGSQVTCEATFVLRNGIVETASFRADPQQDSQMTALLCRPIIQSCGPA